MPLRRSVTSLESLAINKLDLVIETVILRSAEYISEHYYRDKIRWALHCIDWCVSGSN